MIAVVDDDRPFRGSVEALLWSAGFHAVGYGSALEFLRSGDVARADCLIADVRMPGMTGLELQESLHKDGLDTPIIIITGKGDIPTAVRAVKAGAFDFIEKPFEGQPFLDSVRSALDTHSRSLDDKRLTEEFRTRYAQLTPREQEVMLELLAGEPNKLVAHRLGVSPRTVEVHRSRIMEKMQARNLPQLIRTAFATGLDLKSRSRPASPYVAGSAV